MTPLETLISDIDRRPGTKVITLQYRSDKPWSPDQTFVVTLPKEERAAHRRDLRLRLELAILNGGGLVVRRVTPMKVNGRPVCELFMCYLADGLVRHLPKEEVEFNNRLGKKGEPWGVPPEPNVVYKQIRN